MNFTRNWLWTILFEALEENKGSNLSRTDITSALCLPADSIGQVRMIDLIVCSGCCWIKDWAPVADRWSKWWDFMDLAVQQLSPSAAWLLPALSEDNGRASEHPVCTEGNWGANRTQGWAEKESHCIANRLRRCFLARNTSDHPGQPNTSDWAGPCSLQGERETRGALEHGGCSVALCAV